MVIPATAAQQVNMIAPSTTPLTMTVSGEVGVECRGAKVGNDRHHRIVNMGGEKKEINVKTKTTDN